MQNHQQNPYVATTTAETNTAMATTHHPAGEPLVTVISNQPKNIFSKWAKPTLFLGIVFLVFGILCFISGFVLIAVAPKSWVSYTGSGVWCGVFIIISGSLCIAAGARPERHATRCAALTFCIITICLSFGAAISAYGGFIEMGHDCPKIPKCTYEYDYYEGREVCKYYHCNKNHYNPVGSILSVILGVMASIAIILALVLAVFTGKGCFKCCGCRQQTNDVLINLTIEDTTNPQPSIEYKVPRQSTEQNTYIAVSNYHPSHGHSEQPYATPFSYTNGPAASQHASRTPMLARSNVVAVPHHPFSQQPTLRQTSGMAFPPQYHSPAQQVRQIPMLREAGDIAPPPAYYSPEPVPRQISAQTTPLLRNRTSTQAEDIAKCSRQSSHHQAPITTVPDRHYNQALIEAPSSAMAEPPQHNCRAPMETQFNDISMVEHNHEESCQSTTVTPAMVKDQQKLIQESKPAQPSVDNTQSSLRGGPEPTNVQTGDIADIQHQMNQTQASDMTVHLQQAIQ